MKENPRNIIDEKIHHFIDTQNIIKKDVKNYISKSVLEKTGYCNLFPDNLIMIDSENCLCPTICHRIYVEYENKDLESCKIIYADGICGRKQDLYSNDDIHNPVFNMGEFVVLGNKDFVENSLLNLTRQIINIFNQVFSYVSLKNSTDTFFEDSKNRILSAFQKNDNVKQEILSNNKVIGSVNRPGTKFGNLFNIRDRKSVV